MYETITSQSLPIRMCEGPMLYPGRVVFVVDDEKTISATVAMILKASGYDARCFFDPVSALQAAQFLAPDLLLSDVMMPKMNGIELAIQVTQSCANCRVLLFSGHISTSDLLDAAVLQGHQFEILAKPVHPRELLEKLDEMFAA
jgi:CheY-like chemotaxis protein